MNPELQKTIERLSIELFDKVKFYREHIHAHPELSYQEHNTMAFVSEQLSKLGIEHTTKIGDTGIVAIIRNENHIVDAECIGLRADLDALPINEENDVVYKSTIDGVMHACGHDVHTSILLGAA